MWATVAHTSVDSLFTLLGSARMCLWHHRCCFLWNAVCCVFVELNSILIFETTERALISLIIWSEYCRSSSGLAFGSYGLLSNLTSSLCYYEWWMNCERFRWKQSRRILRYPFIPLERLSILWTTPSGYQASGSFCLGVSIFVPCLDYLRDYALK